MPLPTDDKVVETSQGLVNTLYAINNGKPNPGWRSAHTKGVLLGGKFTPTSAAAKLSKAPHFNRPTTPVVARFSNGSALTNPADSDKSNIRGLAIRFELESAPVRLHTDVVANSLDCFPATTGQEALDFFNSIRDGTFASYLEAHPKAVAFVQAPRPIPVAFGRERYHAIHAYKFVSGEGKEAYIRYRILPAAGEAHLTDAELEGKPHGFLFDGVAETLKTAGPIVFKLVAQVAQEGDVTDDNTVKWPEDREFVELGTVQLETVLDDQEAGQKRIIFDPVPRVDGIEPSADPLLEVRAGVYLLSGRQRRDA